MTAAARVNVGRGTAVVAAALFVAAGAVASYVAIRATNAPASPVPMDMARGGDAPVADVVVALDADAVKRAGIVVAAAESGVAAGALRLPAVVEPNAYGMVTVTPLVAGRVATVPVELGAVVRQGQSLATVFSPELADARERFVSARAELNAHEQELARTEKLALIGAASRQELERIHAEHTAQQATVQSTRARLELLGLSGDSIEQPGAGAIDANVQVPSPIDGVVTERFANIGLNVDPGVKLFTIVDLSTVWIVASVYEADFAKVRVGSRASVSTPAYPDVRLDGRVSYIDPQLNLETRTAKVRVEVPNSGRRLRLGMLAEMLVEGPGRAAVVLIPRSAVQTVGNRSVVYVPTPNAPERFTEREVRLGAPSGDRVEVVTGLMPGDQVVIEGGFFLRAEHERLRPRPFNAQQPGR